MKLESLVIVNQNVTVNLYLGLVHTARHMPGVSFTLRKWKQLIETCFYENFFSKAKLITGMKS